jgi:hypothetical protein
MTGKHNHEFTALWWYFGFNGPQDCHAHSCFDRRCNTVMIGDGRVCRKNDEHHEEKLSSSPPVGTQEKEN